MIRSGLGTLLAAVAYFVAAAGAMAFTRFDGGVALMWPACGLLAGVLAIRPLRRWPVLLCACGLAIFISASRFGLGPASAPFYVPVSLLEPVVIVLGLRWLLAKRQDASPVRKLAIFVAVAGLVAPALSAPLGGTIAHVMTGMPWWGLTLSWFSAHALGNLIVIPVIDGIRELPKWTRRAALPTWLGAAALLLIFAAITGAVFWQATYPLLFLPLVPLVAIAFLLGMPGTAAAMLLIGVIGGVATALGTGPLALLHESVGLGSQFFQLYLASAGLIAFPMAAELDRRTALANELRRSEASYRLLADRMGDVLLRLSVDGTIEYASPSILRMGGLTPESVVGKSAQDLVVAEDRDAVVKAHREAVQNPATTAVVEYRFNRADGQLRWLETHTRAYCGEDHHVAGVVSAIRDVTDRKNTEKELLWEATTDPLTGIGNRRAFDRALARAKAAADAGGPGGCVAIFDIDHFKRVNDTHGHDAGDAVIRALASTLRACLREGDFAGRLGGEEFGLILTAVDQRKAAIVCERVRRAFQRRPVMHAGGVITCKTASAGICALDRATDPEALVRLADEALYRAKNEGRDRLALVA